ncbi:hypothetical protein WJX81_000292 [Elliptochloris bilobata]|uniref:Uncharacterized protein n=1 Tax=Elliptochloris bilobata TaxID=381761 RepID=A0AAW1QY91_9CHLO
MAENSQWRPAGTAVLAGRVGLRAWLFDKIWYTCKCWTAGIVLCFGICHSQLLLCRATVPDTASAEARARWVCATSAYTLRASKQQSVDTVR